jgi:hypothetical protein
MKIQWWIAVSVVIAIGTGHAAAQSEKPSTCAAQAAWATSPSLPDFSKEPADECTFNQYAWQSFLYLTQPARPQGALLFQTFPTVSGVFPGMAAAESACVNEDENGDFQRVFLLRRAKSKDAEHTQAGSGGVLVDQAGSVTYYEQYYNPRFASFVHRCGLDILSCQTSEQTANLHTPVGSIELKAAWRPIKREDPTYNRFHTIRNVNVEDPQTGKCQKTDLALVGLHLVYAPVGHPELIWATFEHIANGPDGPCTGKPTTPPAGFSKWTYNDKTSTDCSKVNSWDPDNPYKITQAFRNWAYGYDPSQPRDNENIRLTKALNQSVARILPASSVWKNYYLIGSVWTTDGVLPAVQAVPPTPGNLAGAPFLANLTMETYTQTPNPLDSTAVQKNSCMFCHNTGTQTPRSFQVSHAFANAYQTAACPWLPPTGTGELPAACLDTQGPRTKTAGTTAAPELIPSH